MLHQHQRGNAPLRLLDPFEEDRRAAANTQIERSLQSATRDSVVIDREDEDYEGDGASDDDCPTPAFRPELDVGCGVFSGLNDDAAVLFEDEESRASSRSNDERDATRATTTAAIRSTNLHDDAPHGDAHHRNPLLAQQRQPRVAPPRLPDPAYVEGIPVPRILRNAQSHARQRQRMSLRGDRDCGEGDAEDGDEDDGVEAGYDENDDDADDRDQGQTFTDRQCFGDASEWQQPTRAAATARAASNAPSKSRAAPRAQAAAAARKSVVPARTTTTWQQQQQQHQQPFELHGRSVRQVTTVATYGGRAAQTGSAVAAVARGATIGRGRGNGGTAPRGKQQQQQRVTQQRNADDYDDDDDDDLANSLVWNAEYQSARAVAALSRRRIPATRRAAAPTARGGNKGTKKNTAAVAPAARKAAKKAPTAPAAARATATAAAAVTKKKTARQKASAANRTAKAAAQREQLRLLSGLR